MAAQIHGGSFKGAGVHRGSPLQRVGKPYAEACYDFDWGISSLRYFAEEIRRVTGTTYSDNGGRRGEFYHLVDQRPLGVVVGHLAWNYPLGNAALKIGPTIASGCCCVLKPSSQTPLATLYLGEIMHRIGLPAGVVNIIAGPAGELGDALNISRIPKMITLIGSTDTGRQVMAQGASSIKTYSLELGGNAPAIIMEDGRRGAGREAGGDQPGVQHRTDLHRLQPDLRARQQIRGVLPARAGGV